MTSLQSTPKKHNLFCWKQNLQVYSLESTTWETVSFNTLFVASKLHISSINTQFFIEKHHSILIWNVYRTRNYVLLFVLSVLTLSLV